MKALLFTRYGEPEFLTLEDVSRPEPKAGEVLVRVKAASVNDWDWAMIRGKPFFMRLFGGLFRPSYRILGVDVAGEVVETGSGVSRLRIGDQVYGDLSEAGFGAFAEYVAVSEQALRRMPANFSHAQAAAIPHAALLALQGLRLGRFAAGEKLLINGGGGGVGTIGVQIAKALGATEVTGVDSGDKHDRMNEAGFTQTLDYRMVDFTALPEQYDLILDTKTTRSPRRYTEVLRPGGRYVTVGGDTPRLLQVLAASKLSRFKGNKEVRILALKPNKGLDEVTELIESGKVVPHIDGPYLLEQATEAIRLFGEARHKGKVILKIGEEE